jgi:hypothetical protein
MAIDHAPVPRYLDHAAHARLQERIDHEAKMLRNLIKRL